MGFLCSTGCMASFVVFYGNRRPDFSQELSYVMHACEDKVIHAERASTPLAYADVRHQLSRVRAAIGL